MGLDLFGLKIGFDDDVTRKPSKLIYDISFKEIADYLKVDKVTYVKIDTVNKCLVVSCVKND